MKKHLSSIVIICFALLAIGGIAAGVYFYRQYQQTEAKLKNPDETAKNETKALLTKVGKLMLLPAEEPTVASIADVEKLKDQPFFKNAKNGDTVLIFPQEKKAVLYRSEGNFIVEVAPLVMDQTQATATANPQAIGTPQPQQTTTSVVLRNGTDKVGIVKNLEDELKQKLQGIVIAGKDNAKKTTYEKTLIVDLTGTKTDQTKAFAQFLGAVVSELPAGETKPANADFLIILGADRN